ncbi:hypothetical protein LTR36_003497 [Oleoguttula mirabilis]|uniref:Uncharacterized protein n=1 Tax=Oleoguttula mirabilis TaxID=1507867 RepID=A0AAV9JJ93_9PEZI|nr:hypothetical protein LTR36_003497 [Oleoguttula mirabilis]
MAEEHPAACYGFTIDLLSLAFHSIAFRGRASSYGILINGSADRLRQGHAKTDVSAQADSDNDTESVTSVSTMTSSTETSDNSADLDFEEASSRTSSPRGTSPKVKGKVGDSGDGPRVVREWLASQSQHRKAEDQLEHDSPGAETVGERFAGFLAERFDTDRADPAALLIVEDNGMPTTGYQKAVKVQEEDGAGSEESDNIQVGVRGAEMLDGRQWRR